MTKVNRKVEYALMALKLMSNKRPGELTSANEVVAATGVPFDATARVLQSLASQGILRSEHGAHGGYQIVRDLSRISFYDLIEIISGPLGIVKCLHDDEGSCDLIGKCNVQTPLNELNRKMKEFYQSLSLRELLKVKESVIYE